MKVFMKAQISVEFIIGLFAWLVFLGTISFALLSMNENAKTAAERIEITAKVHQITSLIEQTQSTGFLVTCDVPKHKYKNGYVVLEDSGKEIVENTIFGVEEINGQPT